MTDVYTIVGFDSYGAFCETLIKTLTFVLSVVGVEVKVPVARSSTEQQACRFQRMLTWSRLRNVFHHVFRPQFDGIVIQDFVRSVNPFKNLSLAVIIGGQNAEI